MLFMNTFTLRVISWEFDRIADEEGGNLFCFSISEKDNGAIYYYNHEFEYNENSEHHIVFLSGSLSDFINSLVEY
ncbi:SMI1/KNR4 family protein [Bacillus rhizoplanae]|uniref:SMI1/KNR4 family protein n=1 Tax=Bacillus rhizoplanae TaxID=2880966 RepID=UPI003D1B6170